MSQPPFSIHSGNPTHPLQGRRRAPCDTLLLTEINPHFVLDHAADWHRAAVELHSFGTLREPCPKCQKASLNLILRQTHVRVAHLLCADCNSCYDAHYPDGAPALTI